MIRNKIFFSLPGNNLDMIPAKNLIQGNLSETFETDNSRQPFMMPVFSLSANNVGLPVANNLIQGNLPETMPIRYLQKNISYTMVEDNEHIVHPSAQLIGKTNY